MSDPTAPIHLPPLTFLMSDHTTASLSVDVAEALSLRNHTLFVDDFLAPIHQGLQSMFEIDWRRDMGDPRATQRLMLEALDGESSERDVIVSLERWFNETFGEAQLPKMALHRMKTNREMFSYPYLFRDATPKHLQPFIADSSIPRRDMLMVWLSPYFFSQQPFDIRNLTWPSTPSVEQVLQSVSELAL